MQIQYGLIQVYVDSIVWNPHRLGLIKDLEKVQMRATKLVISIKNLTYKDRLNKITNS